jgi:hypothetical protein
MEWLAKGAIAKRRGTVFDKYVVSLKSRTNAGHNPFAERNIINN